MAVANLPLESRSSARRVSPVIYRSSPGAFDVAMEAHDRWVASVDVLPQSEWATLARCLPLGMDRRRCIALKDADLEIDYLAVIGINGADCQNH
jgi:hypothetical protein